MAMAEAAVGEQTLEEGEASLTNASWSPGGGRSKRSERLMRTVSTASLSESLESWKQQVLSQLRAEREVTDVQFGALRQDVAARALAKDVLLGVERSRDDILAQLRETFAADSGKLGKQLERVTASLSERIDELNQRIDGLIDFRLGSLWEDDDDVGAADTLDVTMKKEPGIPQPQQPPPSGGDVAAAAAATAAAVKAGAAAGAAASARLAERVDSLESRLADTEGALESIRSLRTQPDAPAAARAPTSGSEGSEAAELKRRLAILEEAVAQGSASSQEQLSSGLSRLEALLAQQVQAARDGEERLEGRLAELDAALGRDRAASEERLALLGNSLRREVSSTRELAAEASARAEATTAKVDASTRRGATPNAVPMAALPQAELASAAPAPPLGVQQVAAPPAAKALLGAAAPPEEEKPAPSEDSSRGGEPGASAAEVHATLVSDPGFVSALSSSLKGELGGWLDDAFETHWARWQEEGRLAVPMGVVQVEPAADWPLQQRRSFLAGEPAGGARVDGLAGVEAYAAEKDGIDEASFKLLATRVATLEGRLGSEVSEDRAGAARPEGPPASPARESQGGGMPFVQLMEIGCELRGLRLRLGYLERCVPTDIQRALRYFEPSEPQSCSPREQDPTQGTQLVEDPGQAKASESDALHEVANLSKALRSLQRDKDAQSSRLQDLQAAQNALESRVEATLPRLCSALEGFAAGASGREEGDPGLRQSMLSAIPKSVLDASAGAAPSGASHEEVRTAVQAALVELRGELLGLGSSLHEAIDCKADVGQVQMLATRLEAVSVRRYLPEPGSKPGSPKCSQERKGGDPFPEPLRNVWSPAHAHRRSPATGRRSNADQLAPVKFTASHGTLLVR